MKIGLVTIGQSPRTDILKDIEPVLKQDNIESIECGALDGLSMSEINSLEPEPDKDHILVTRLLDGTEVKLSRSKIIPMMQNCISKLEGKVDAIVILCTGEFPELKSQNLLIEPSTVLTKLVEAISPDVSLTLLIPSSDQEEELRSKWKNRKDTTIVAISPYTSSPEDFKNKLEGIDAGQLVIMDCFGYTSQMKEITKNTLRRPVILPRTLVARLIGEIAR
ncbi:MAG: AroM family protein [Candidatus Acidifodinimicrobium sp.]